MWLISLHFIRVNFLVITDQVNHFEKRGLSQGALVSILSGELCFLELFGGRGEVLSDQTQVLEQFLEFPLFRLIVHGPYFIAINQNEEGFGEHLV